MDKTRTDSGQEHGGMAWHGMVWVDMGMDKTWCELYILFIPKPPLII